MGDTLLTLIEETAEGWDTPWGDALLAVGEGAGEERGAERQVSEQSSLQLLKKCAFGGVEAILQMN